MKKLSFKLIRKIAVGGLFVTLTFVILGQGCGLGFQGTDSASLSSFGDCSGASTKVIDKNYRIEPNRETASVGYGDQILNSYVSCTGIERPSQRTVDEFNSRRQSLSEFGSLTDVSGALMMAVSAVAAEVCQDLVEREAALPTGDRGIFTNINFAGSSLSLSEMNEAADMLGIACWQRTPNNEERIQITNSIGQLNLNSRLSAVSLCTAMLSTFAGVIE